VHDVDSRLRVLTFGEEQPWWHCPGLCVSPFPADGEPAEHDAVVLDALTETALQDGAALARLQQLAMDTAVVVLAPGLSEASAMGLLQAGVQDVLTDSQPAQVARALRFSVERKRLERSARLAYATDLDTGLPHQDQLLEYVSQLIALRAREPAALVLIVLRTEGLLRVAGQLGREGAQVLRRKLAVRLRAALRASDVVASIGADMFGILLGHVDSAADGHKVVGKLVQTLQQPLQLAGQQCDVEVAAGLAQWPEHGQDPVELLQRAKAQAASTAAMGRQGYGIRIDRPAGQAANDEAAAE
jgi:diguanylate cyclase (GGDEF)-like protein